MGSNYEKCENNSNELADIKEEIHVIDRDFAVLQNSIMEMKSYFKERMDAQDKTLEIIAEQVKKTNGRTTALEVKVETLEVNSYNYKENLEVLVEKHNEPILKRIDEIDRIARDGEKLKIESRVIWNTLTAVGSALVAAAGLFIAWKSGK